MTTLTENGHALYTHRGYNDSDEPMYCSRFDLAESDDANEPLYLIPELLSGSDYSYGSVTASNYRVFLDQFQRVPGVHAISGGHGTYAVAVALSTYRDNDEIRETLDALEDYPVMDDEDLCTLEAERQDEAWSDWACSDYLSALSKRFEVKFLDVDTGVVRQTFETTAEDIHEYWESENSSRWIDVDRVANATRYEDIQDWIDWLWSAVPVGRQEEAA